MNTPYVNPMYQGQQMPMGYQQQQQFGYPPPNMMMYGAPMGGGGGGYWNPSMFGGGSGGGLLRGANTTAKVNLDISKLKPDEREKILGLDKMSKIHDIAVNGAGFALAGLNLLQQSKAQNSMIKLQETHEANMYDLAGKNMDLQGKLAEFGMQGQRDQAKLVRDLAQIQADVAKYKIKMDSKTSVENTKTAYNTSFYNSRFYNHGNPAVSTNMYI